MELSGEAARGARGAECAGTGGSGSVGGERREKGTGDGGVEGKGEGK